MPKQLAGVDLKTVSEANGVEFFGDWKGYILGEVASSAKDGRVEWTSLQRIFVEAIERCWLLVSVDMLIKEKIAELALSLVKEGKLVMYWDGRVLDDTSKLEMFDLVDPKASFAVAQVEA